MTIDLEEPPPEPEWPAGLEPRPFEREHARAFWAADDEAFGEEPDYESEPFEEFVARRIENPRFDPELWTAVWDGDEIAATLIADWKRFGAGWMNMSISPASSSFLRIFRIVCSPGTPVISRASSLRTVSL